MGILDDAIRDHLELKRKGGTQESDLERLENEAFGPPSRPGDAPGAVATAEPPEGLNPESADERSEPDTGQASIPTTQMPAPEAPVEAPAPAPAEQGGETDAPEGEVVFHDFAAEEGLVPPRAVAPSAPPVEQDVGRPESEQERREPEPSEPTTPAPAPAGETSADDTQPHNVEAEFGSAESRPESPPADRAEAEEIEIDDDLELHLDEEDLATSAGLDRAEPETGGGEPPSEPELTAVEDEVVEEDIGEEDVEVVEEEVDEPSEEAPEDAGADDEEDVLEETPDFLRETPEHDRLWFEQKPPKDFDFDE
jgi:hypothetical protein